MFNRKLVLLYLFSALICSCKQKISVDGQLRSDAGQAPFSPFNAEMNALLQRESAASICSQDSDCVVPDKYEDCNPTCVTPGYAIAKIRLPEFIAGSASLLSKHCSAAAKSSVSCKVTHQAVCREKRCVLTPLGGAGEGTVPGGATKPVSDEPPLLKAGDDVSTLPMAAQGTFQSECDGFSRGRLIVSDGTLIHVHQRFQVRGCTVPYSTHHFEYGVSLPRPIANANGSITLRLALKKVTETQESSFAVEQARGTDELGSLPWEVGVALDITPLAVKDSFIQSSLDAYFSPTSMEFLLTQSGLRLSERVRSECSACATPEIESYQRVSYGEGVWSRVAPP